MSTISKNRKSYRLRIGSPETRFFPPGRLALYIVNIPHCYYKHNISIWCLVYLILCLLPAAGKMWLCWPIPITDDINWPMICDDEWWIVVRTPYNPNKPPVGDLKIENGARIVHPFSMYFQAPHSYWVWGFSISHVCADPILIGWEKSCDRLLSL